MKVFKRPGSSYYAYKFQYRGKEYYRSTGTENRREAESIAGAARTRIVRQAAGLEQPEPQRKSSATMKTQGHSYAARVSNHFRRVGWNRQSRTKRHS